MFCCSDLTLLGTELFFNSTSDHRRPMQTYQSATDPRGHRKTNCCRLCCITGGLVSLTHLRVKPFFIDPKLARQPERITCHSPFSTLQNKSETFVLYIRGLERKSKVQVKITTGFGIAHTYFKTSISCGISVTFHERPWNEVIALGGWLRRVLPVCFSLTPWFQIPCSSGDINRSSTGTVSVEPGKIKRILLSTPITWPQRHSSSSSRIVVSDEDLELDENSNRREKTTTVVVRFSNAIKSRAGWLVCRSMNDITIYIWNTLLDVLLYRLLEPRYSFTLQTDLNKQEACGTSSNPCRRTQFWKLKYKVFKWTNQGLEYGRLTYEV